MTEQKIYEEELLDFYDILLEYQEEESDIKAYYEEYATELQEEESY